MPAAAASVAAAAGTAAAAAADGNTEAEAGAVGVVDRPCDLECTAVVEANVDGEVGAADVRPDSNADGNGAH